MNAGLSSASSQPVWRTATSWNDSESAETGRLLDRSHTLDWSAVMDRQENNYNLREGDFDEKWKMESKESNLGSSTATPANTPTEETEDNGLAEQVKTKLMLLSNLLFWLLKLDQFQVFVQNVVLRDANETRRGEIK